MPSRECLLTQQAIAASLQALCGLCAAMDRKDTGNAGYRETHGFQRIMEAPKASGCAVSKPFTGLH